MLGVRSFTQADVFQVHQNQDSLSTVFLNWAMLPLWGLPPGLVRGAELVLFTNSKRLLIPFS